MASTFTIILHIPANRYHENNIPRGITNAKKFLILL